MIVIKFVQRYGYEAHQILPNKKLAPQLYYCGLIGGDQGDDILTCTDARGSIDCNAGGVYVGPTRMVVMAYSGQKNSSSEGQLLTVERRRDLEQALELLHSAGQVFGDLRPPNVIYLEATRPASDPSVHLIDFDWSGTEGTVHYPPHLTSGLWVPGVESYNKITKEADISLLNKYFTAPL